MEEALLTFVHQASPLLSPLGICPVLSTLPPKDETKVCLEWRMVSPGPDKAAGEKRRASGQTYTPPPHAVSWRWDNQRLLGISGDISPRSQFVPLC